MVSVTYSEAFARIVNGQRTLVREYEGLYQTNKRTLIFTPKGPTVTLILAVAHTLRNYHLHELRTLPPTNMETQLPFKLTAVFYRHFLGLHVSFREGKASLEGEIQGLGLKI